MKTQMVKGTLYRKAKSRAKMKVSAVDIEREDILVTRSWAEELNERNDKEPDGIMLFVIDEKATDKYYKDVKALEKKKAEKKELDDLKSSDLAYKILDMAVTNKGKEETKL